MKTVLAVIGAVAVLLVLGLFALCNDDDGEDGFGSMRIVLASHECEDPGCYDDCGDESYEGHRSSRDGHRGGRDKRTCFFGCDNVIIVPGLPGMGGNEPPPEEGL